MKYFKSGTWVNDDTITVMPVGATALTDAEWDNRQSVPYQPTLDELKAKALGMLTQDYNTAIQQPVAYMGTTFQADTASQDVLSKSLAPGAVPAGFAWLDANNAWVPMTFAQLQGLAGVMLGQGFTAFQRLRQRKDAVAAAATVATVDAVVW